MSDQNLFIRTCQSNGHLSDITIYVHAYYTTVTVVLYIHTYMVKPVTPRPVSVRFGNTINAIVICCSGSGPCLLYNVLCNICNHMIMNTYTCRCTNTTMTIMYNYTYGKRQTVSKCKTQSVSVCVCVCMCIMNYLCLPLPVVKDAVEMLHSMLPPYISI